MIAAVSRRSTDTSVKRSVSPGSRPRPPHLKDLAHHSPECLSRPLAPPFRRACACHTSSRSSFQSPARPPSLPPLARRTTSTTLSGMRRIKGPLAAELSGADDGNGDGGGGGGPDRRTDADGLLRARNCRAHRKFRWKARRRRRAEPYTTCTDWHGFMHACFVPIKHLRAAAGLTR